MFLATVNDAGYLPDSQGLEFETAQDAWNYLSTERELEEMHIFGTGFGESFDAKVLIALQNLAKGKFEGFFAPDGVGLIGAIDGDRPLRVYMVSEVPA